jgi:hypothetical protein
MMGYHGNWDFLLDDQKTKIKTILKKLQVKITLRP